ncbi:hypothetical protein EYF80_032723 [Liparis tanakae]|uniref:Uncharacterized protein n=1 Tax=Liparis tanakae TaxID=230148 RepID=A0A4Z2GTY4_9TELE|nr:hypothetical protein EYF80_032723 [Liparis tanakae]
MQCQDYHPFPGNFIIMGTSSCGGGIGLFAFYIKGSPTPAALREPLSQSGEETSRNVTTLIKKGSFVDRYPSEKENRPPKKNNGIA